MTFSKSTLTSSGETDCVGRIVHGEREQRTCNRGGTCDQADVMDKESGIYAMFAFTALYEQTGNRKWLYEFSGDAHYRDLAEFIHRNTKQANDIDGSCGYRYVGLVNEGGSITEQQYFGNYH